MIPIVLGEGAIKPTRAHPTDAGWDLYTPYDIYILPNQLSLVNTRVRIAIPSGFFGHILGRSSLGARFVTPLGGVVDSSYRGDLTVIPANFGDMPYTARIGDKIAQLVIMSVNSQPLVQVETLDDTARGGGGFGSSGR